MEARVERSTRFHWFDCGVRLPSLQNNSGGSSRGRLGLRDGTAGHGRREQAVPPALLWRLEQEDQRLKKHDGRWIDIQRLRLLESFVDVYNN